MYIIFDDNPTCNEKQFLGEGKIFIHHSYKSSVGSMFRRMNLDFRWDFRTAFQIVGTIKGGDGGKI